MRSLKELPDSVWWHNHGSDMVKSPKANISNMEELMTGNTKPSDGNKPQSTPPSKPTPAPVPPQERNLRTGWTIVGDSAEGIRKKSK